MAKSGSDKSNKSAVKIEKIAVPGGVGGREPPRGVVATARDGRFPSHRIQFLSPRKVFFPESGWNCKTDRQAYLSEAYLLELTLRFIQEMHGFG